MTVRDSVVVAATLPRFLNVGDRSEMHVDIDNVEGDAGEYKLDLDIHGPLTADADAMTKTVRLDPHQRKSVAMPIAAAGIGVAELDLRLTGPKTDLTQHFRLGIASGAPDSYRRTVTPLPGGASQTISGDLLADFIPGTGSIAISASPFGALDAPALLAALQRYPYGCSEQTVSVAMPLLYVNRLASIEHLGVDPDLDGRINQAIERELSRQSASGAFGMWSADSNDDDLWLDAFVTDFLTRARERNFAVPQPSLRPGARPAAQRSRQHARAEQGQCRGDRLCALCSRPQRAARDWRPALSHRRQARRLHDPARQGSACGCARDAWRPGARGRRLRRGAQGARRRARRGRVAARLWLAAARRRGRARARRRGQARQHRERRDRARRRRPRAGEGRALALSARRK